MSIRRIRWFALMLAASAMVASCDADAQACKCVHLGQNVQCPPGLPDGSRSVQFVSEGTNWQLPSGQVVFVPSATFAPCPVAAPPPVATPPVATPPAPTPPAATQPPPAPAPVATPPPPSTPPPPATTSKPPPETTPPPPASTPPTASPPPSKPPGESTPPTTTEQPRSREPPRTPPIGPATSSGSRARQLIETPPIAPGGSTPPDEGPPVDETIRRLGRPQGAPPPAPSGELPPGAVIVPSEPLTTQPRLTPGTQTRPPPGPGTTTRPPKPIPETPGKPPDLTPPPPTIFGEELEEDFCCGRKGSLITYPVTSDPLQPPQQYEAPRDPAVGAVQVFLHNNAFFTNQIDLEVPALAFDIVWTRHFRGDVEYTDGGLMGHGWDFVYNKRLVPIAARKLANGLFAEQAGVEKAALWYYSGQGRAERYVERDSNERDVVNFDATFRAYVTRYESPPGQFHEFERYVLLPKQPHPFAEHQDVEKTERIFYVLREKNGTRYVFNCRGQLIYILSRNDSRARNIRVTLKYGGPINPLTQNRMLNVVEDAAGRKYVVETTPINQGSYATNYECKFQYGVEKIHRIERIVGGGLVVQYHYRGKEDPTLVAVTIAADGGGATRRWEYAYGGNRQMTTYRDPNACAKGTADAVTVRNEYDGKRVTAQTLGAQRLTIAGATVTDGVGDRFTYSLAQVGGFPVVEQITVQPANAGLGGPWRTRFAHNDDTQVTSITLPGGGGFRYGYQEANAPVTLGPIRDRPGITYENNLARGNLLTVTRFGRGESPDTLASTQSYEPLYNQLAEATDAAGNLTRYTYGDYVTPSLRGNPTAIQDPPVRQPDGSELPRPPNRFAYNVFGQREASNIGAGQITTYDYGKTGALVRITYPDGAAETFERGALDRIVRHVSAAGTVDYERDGFGMLKRRVVDPTGLRVVTEFEHDANGNEVAMHEEVRDHVDFAPPMPGFVQENAYRRTVRRDIDALGRPTRETITAPGGTLVTTWRYRANGMLEETTRPSRNGTAPHRTTFRHDARGLPVEIVEAAGTPAAFVTRREYDANGNPLRIAAGYGNPASAVTLRYDGLDRLTAAVDALGAETHYTHDKTGNVTQVEVRGGGNTLRRSRFTYDAYGNVIVRTADSLAGAVEESRWHYSPLLRLERVVSPNGGETRFQYDMGNRVTAITDPLGNVTSNAYDGAGRLARTEMRAPERSIDTATGQLRAVDGVMVTTSEYDALGRATRVAAAGREERTLYDSAGRVRATLSATGQLATVRYDGLGRRIEVAGPLTTQKFAYTPGGLVREVSGSGGHHAFAYDANGRVTQREDRRTGGKTTFAYKEQGRVVETVDPNGTKLTVTANAAGLPVSEIAIPSTRTAPGKGGHRVVGGDTGVYYEYDVLGRVTRGRVGGGADVRMAYDGLDRVVEETQTFAGRSETIARRFSDDQGWTETTYPQIAGGTRVRLVADKLGRVDSVYADNAPVATYAYSGLDRLALRRAGNGIETRFRYDAQHRLEHVQVAQPGTPGASATAGVRWAQGVQYDARGPAVVTDTRFASAGGSDVVMQTRFQRDSFGRAVATTTSTAVTTGTPGVVTDETSGSFSRFDGARLVEIVNYDGWSADRARAVRVDRFEHDGAQRVRRVTTSGEFDTKIADLPLQAATVTAAMGSASIAATGTQAFDYDANGNLVFDGRYRYTYDFRNRLVQVLDSRGPWGYHQWNRYNYDAFDRRVAMHRKRDGAPQSILANAGPKWNGAMSWYLFDGRQVIVEAWRDHDATGLEPSLLAQYIHGGRPGEILRVDRRREDDPRSALQRYYVHEDVNGTIRELSDALGVLHPVRQGDPSLAAGEPLGERPPGDALMVGRTGVRMPYVGAATRVDGFAAVPFRDDLGYPIHDYRRASDFHVKAGRDMFAASVSAFQNKMLLTMGGIAAVAIAPAVIGAAAPYLATLAASAQANAGGIVVGALVGGTTSLGMSAGTAWWTQSGYSLSEGAEAFGTGALFGASGGWIGGLGMGLVKELGADLAASFALGVSLDVVRGADLAEAVQGNVKSGLMDGVIGFGAGVAGAAARSVSVRIANRAAHAAPQPPKLDLLPPVAVADFSAPPTPVHTSAPPRRVDNEPLPAGFIAGAGVPRSVRTRLLAEDILSDLDNGTSASREIGRRIREEYLEVNIYRAAPGSQTANFYGYWDPADPSKIFLNFDAVMRNPRTGRYVSEGAAGTIVHEGLHAMGGGEITAHVGQAIFLYRTFKRDIMRVPRGIDLTASDLPRLQSTHIELLNRARTNDLVRVIEFVLHDLRYAPGRVPMYSFVRTDRWINLHGGWARALNIADPLYAVMIESARRRAYWADLFESGNYAMGNF